MAIAIEFYGLPVVLLVLPLSLPVLLTPPLLDTFAYLADYQRQVRGFFIVFVCFNAQSSMIFVLIKYVKI